MLPDDKKMVLVGELNPYGGNQDYALYPAPDGCSGHRLCCKVLRMGRRAYLDSFQRVNLCAGVWSARTAKTKALAIMDQFQLLGGGRAILLGSKVCSAFGVKYAPFETFDLLGVDLLVLPHPSGRCRAWNAPGAFRRAREAVTELYPEVAGLLGRDGEEETPE